MGLCGDFTFFGHVIRQMQLLLLTMEILLERNDRSLVLCGIQELTICVCTRTKSQRRSNYRFRQNFTFLKRKRNRYPRWRRNLLYVFDWVWKLSIVKFPQSPILLLNKSVFPIAMYCFCRFLYPRTECIMWYGLCGYFTLSLSLWPLEWTNGCKRSDRKESRCLSYSPATNIMWIHITPLQRMISFDIRLQGTQTIEK